MKHFEELFELFEPLREETRYFYGGRRSITEILRSQKEQENISKLEKRRNYIESKDYKGDSKIPDSINDEIINFLENSPYGTGLPKNIEELLKAQLDYQYKIKTEYDFKDKKLDVSNFFANTHNKTIECNFNFYGPFEWINYWSGRAIYYPTKKQFELYNIWPFCEL